MEQLFKEDDIVLHDKLGVGRVALVDGTSVLVEFESGKEELYEVTLKKQPPIKVLTPEGFILKAKKTPDELKALAQNDSVAVIEALHSDFGTELSADLIKKNAVPAAVEAAEWDEWWKKTVAILKADPRFILDKNCDVHYRGNLGNIAEDLLSSFKRAHNIKEKEKICKEILRMEEQGVPVEDAKEAAIYFFTGTAASTTNNLGARYEALNFLEGLDPFQFKLVKQDIDNYIRRLDMQGAAEALSVVTDNAIRTQILYVFEELLPDFYTDITETLTKRFRKTQRDWVLDTLLIHKDPKHIKTLVDATLADVHTNQQPFIWLAKKMFEDPTPLEDLGYDVQDVMRRMFKLLLELHVTSAFSATKDGPSVSREEDEMLKFLLKKDAFLNCLKKHTDDTVLLVASLYSDNSAMTEEDRDEMIGKLRQRYPNLDFTFKRGEEEEEERDQLILSKETFEKYEIELREIIEQKIPETAQAIKTAREWGDLSENAEYHAAKEKQALLFSRKRELERILDTARVI